MIKVFFYLNYSCFLLNWNNIKVKINFLWLGLWLILTNLKLAHLISLQDWGFAIFDDDTHLCKQYHHHLKSEHRLNFYRKGIMSSFQILTNCFLSHVHIACFIFGFQTFHFYNNLARLWRSYLVQMLFYSVDLYLLDLHEHYQNDLPHDLFHESNLIPFSKDIFWPEYQYQRL